MAVKLPIAPMLAAKVPPPAEGRPYPLWDRPDLMFEPKLDGIRLIVQTGPTLRLWSRSGRDCTAEWPELESLRKFDGSVLDGELCVRTEGGRPSFNALQNVGSLSKQQRLERVVFFAFDLLAVPGANTMPMPYVDRRYSLDRALILHEPVANVQILPSVRDGKGLWDLDPDGEGLVAKPVRSRYVPGNRGVWSKIKRLRRKEVEIVGWTESDKAGRPFGALLLGQVVDGRLAFIGKCGTGWDGQTMESLSQRLREHEVHADISPLSRVDRINAQREGSPRKCHWTGLGLRGVIEYAETDAGIVKYPSWKGLAA